MKQNRPHWHRHPQFLYGVLLAGIGAWWLLILAAPLFAAREEPFLAGAIYFFFHKICHQLPERSFFLWGKQLAVCSRCTGLYIGFSLAALAYPLLFRLKPVNNCPRWILLLALVPMGADFIADAIGIFANSGSSRLISGVIAGAAALFFVLPGILSMGGHEQMMHS